MSNEVKSTPGGSGIGKPWIVGGCLLAFLGAGGLLLLVVVGGILWWDAAGRDRRHVEQRAGEQRLGEQRLAEQQRLADRRLAEQQRLERLAAELQQHRARLVDLQRELDGVRTSSADLDARVKVYMADHPEAVVALVLGVGGGGVALDESNQYTDEAKAVGGIAAAIALAWAAQNMDDVQTVLGELNKASIQKKNYEDQVSRLTTSISEEEAKIRELESGATSSAPG